VSEGVLLARLALSEAFRRRVFWTICLITLVIGLVYVVAVNEAFNERSELVGFERLVYTRELLGASMLGIGMAGTLFLAGAAGIFLSAGAVRGDAERGLLQPLVVRPAGRQTTLLARAAAAILVTAVYALLLYAAAVVTTGVVGDWWPDQVVGPGAALIGATVILTALAILGSVFLSPMANGIAVFGVFGAGLLGGVLQQVGDAIGSSRVEQLGDATAWVLPFEALYQHALSVMGAGAPENARDALQATLFGGAASSSPGWLALWATAFFAVTLGLALWRFRRQDL
jgi:ABC-type transport system involved in multi-copper enzyme maturation permease subunit